MTDNLPIATSGLDLTNPEVLDTIRATVAKGTSDAEFKMFIEICKASGLNPFRKEVWCIVIPARDGFVNKQGYQVKPRDRQVQIMTGVNGFFAIANNNPAYDGYESGVLGPDGKLEMPGYPKEDYIGAWCTVYRKDRSRPTHVAVMGAEYDKGEGQWKNSRRTMIMKVAESVGHRKAFPQQMGGLYTAEEMPKEFELVENVTPKAEPKKLEEPKNVSEPPKAPADVKAPEVIKKVTQAPKRLPVHKYKYDKEAIARDLNEGEKEAFWNDAVKKYGAIKDKKYIYSERLIPDAAMYLLKDEPAPGIDSDELPEGMR
jgi:phage recombination protein Bet